MTGGELTVGAVLARLGEREREITAHAETMREQVAQLTAQVDEPGRAAEEVRITHKTVLGRPEPPAPKLPEHLAYQQIMAVFTAADAPAAVPAGVRGVPRRTAGPTPAPACPATLQAFPSPGTAHRNPRP
jgi:hypothetical protein